jgi:DNA ligase-1
MLLAELVATAQAVGATRSRLAKVAALAELLRTCPPSLAAIVVSYLSGDLPQRQIGVGWASVRDLPPAAIDPTLTIAEIDSLFSRIGELSGPGSQRQRRDLLASLFARATNEEQQFLRALLTGELRQGAQVGIMTDAVAKATRIDLAAVRRAAMLRGDLATVAAALLERGSEALDEFHLDLGRAVHPMLAQTAQTVDETLDTLGTAAFDWKLDGARVQIHRNADEVTIYTRTLEDITTRLPEVVDAVLGLPAQRLILDGEVIALRPDKRPQPFQVTASRFGTRRDNAAIHKTMPLTLFAFDILHVDGTDLIDQPASDRLAALDALMPPGMRIPRVITDDPLIAKQFLDDALKAGHEGVVAKSLSAPYEAGRRGAGWLKIKPVHTLDLVVLAIEWGSGRRKGLLSNLHLGARNPDAGGFVMLGKTFKGMTDEMLRWQTERFTELADGPTDGWVVHVRPEQVVEIAFDGVQSSTRYPGGVALRFARVIRYRDDKPADEADTIDTVRAFLPT